MSEQNSQQEQQTTEHNQWAASRYNQWGRKVAYFLLVLYSCAKNISLQGASSQTVQPVRQDGATL